jgi:hypothetical protein
MRLNGSDLDTLTQKHKRKTPRSDIATRDPEMLSMWKAGIPLTEILRRQGLSTGNFAHYFGVIDPTPQALGCPEPSKPGETPEQRAFRRFPITSHKPGP